MLAAGTGAVLAAGTLFAVSHAAASHRKTVPASAGAAQAAGRGRPAAAGTGFGTGGAAGAVGFPR